MLDKVVDDLLKMLHGLVKDKLKFSFAMLFADILFAISFSIFFLFHSIMNNNPPMRQETFFYSHAYRHHYNSLDPDNPPTDKVILNDHLLDDIY